MLLLACGECLTARWLFRALEAASVPELVVLTLALGAAGVWGSWVALEEL